MSKDDEPPLWAGSDRLDPQRDDLKTPCELYNLDCVAYESLVLGLFSIWRGDKNIPPGRPKINEVRKEYFGASRPASTLVEISRLANDDYLVEIEAIAFLPE